MVSNPVKARGQVSLVKLYDGTNGKDGKDGAQGVPGAPGADGKTTYVHVAYADSADGKTNFSTTDPTDRKYIGVLTDFSINDSTDYKLYTWSLAQGPVGPTGSTGATGPKGEDGLTTYVHVAYANSADGKTNFSTTDPVGKSYIGVLTDTTPADSTDYTKYTWSLVKGSDGAQGQQGVQGPKGTDGKTTYVHFAYANSAEGSKDFSTTDTTGRKYIGVFTDTNINDSTNYADYTWSLVQGPTGPTGNTGAVGPKGADGRTTYVHVAYADSVDGLSNFSTIDPTGRKYIGVFTDFNMNDSTTPGDYTWSLAQGPAGPTGNTGATGAKGADGRTTYVHVAYANSADGATSFSTTDPTNRAYIGVLTDFNINDSTNYADYTWSLAKGADGAQGPQGVQGISGAKGADGKTTYVHVAYANSANGSVNFSTTDPTGRAYIGVLTDFNINDSVNYADYTWSLAKGADGSQGPQGPQGLTGAKGIDGKTTYVHVAYANSANGDANFSTTDPTGRAYIGVLTDFNINDSTNYSDYTWSLAKGADGANGAQGVQGPKGADGRTTYVHFAYANSADGKDGFSVSDPVGKAYMGTYTDFTLNDSTNYLDYTWSLVKGSDGANGAQGIQGPKGADGRTTYVHFAYANSADGTTNFSVSDPTGRAYIGTYTDFTINDSTTPSAYTWSLIKGADGANGAQGIQGPKGADGRTTYVHFAYANSAEGTNNFSVSDPTGRTYIGTYTDFTINDSTTPSAYTWSLIKGADGAQGAQGIQGPKGADGRNTYVHFAYAGNSTGTTNFSTTEPTGRAYIGVLTDFNINDSTTPSDYTWSLAQGPTGPTGANGATGTKGADGKTTYVHIAYASNATGTSNFSTTDPTGRTYIGVLTDTNLPDSTNSADYSWSLIKGADGAQGPQGIQGPVGANGKNTYVHFAYANSANGATSFSTTDPTGRAYIGVLTDFNLNDSTNYADYTWSLAKGADGAQGIQGPVGPEGRTPYFHIAYANSADGTDGFYVGGGTNLSTGTNQEYTMGYGIPNTTWQDGYAYLTLPTNVINGEILPQAPHTFYYTLTQGTTYTQTIWIETDANVKDLSAVKITWFIGGVGHDDRQAIVQNLGQNRYKIVSTYTWPGKTDNNVRLFDIRSLDNGFDLTTGTYLKFGKLKLEEGNVSTPWCPAPSEAHPTYMGTYTDYTQSDSLDPTKYTWSLIKGADGANGLPGPKGSDGRTSYVHFAYANSADGTNNFSVSDPTGRAYIGAYSDFTLNDSTTPSAYTWSLAKGADGANGAQGVPGADGKTTYVHFAYANSANGSVGFDVSDPTGRTYIGTYTDFTINDSTNYKSYTWSRMKGDTGNGIANTVIEYQITNTQDQPSDTSGWTTTIPNIGAGVYLWTRTTFVYTDGTKSRTYTVSRQSDNVYTAVLTNDSITLPADASGTVTDFSGSNGSFLVYDGAYQVDSSTVKVQVAQQVNVTVAVGGNSYSITGMDRTKDSGYFDLSYTYKGVLLTKRVSVSKSKRGTDGSNPVIVNLSATSQVFTFDSNNKPYPVNQNINFYTTVSGTNATPVYSAIPYDENGTAGSAIVLGNYGTGGKQLQVAQIGNYQRVVVTVTAGGGTDSTTIARVKDGSSVSPIPDPSNTVSSATPPTNPKEGDWWNDTSQTPNVLKYRYRDKWVQYELDGYYVKANSISGEAIVTNTLEAQKIKYTNSDGTTTNLQTFDLKGIQTAMTDSSGHTYTSMDNAVSSTQTWKSTNNKLDNLKVGGRNLFLNSKTLWNVANNGNSSTKVTFDDTTNMWHITAPAPVTAGRGIYFYQTSNTSKPLVKGDKWAMSIDIKGTGMLREFGAEGSTNQTQPTGPIPSEWTRLSSTGTAVSTGAIIIYFGAGADTTQALDVYVKLPKLELGTMATDYTEAPEDVATWTQAQIKATADQINIGVSSAKSTADAATNKVNNLSVGGTNLLLGTKGFTDPLGTNPWVVVGGYTFTTDGPSGLISHNNAGAWGGPKYKIIDLEQRGLINTTDTYIVSAWVCNTNTSAPITINAYGDAVTWVSQQQVATIRSSDGWVRVSAQFKFLKSTGNTGSLRFEPTAGVPGGIGYIQQAGLKLEKGNLPTDWSPAPEDVPQVNQAYNTEFTSNTDGWDSSPYMNLDTSTGIVTYNRNDLTGNTQNWQMLRQIDSLGMPVKPGDTISASVFIVSSPARGTLPVSHTFNMTVEVLDSSGNRIGNYAKEVSNLANTRVINSNIIAPAGAVSARLKIETDGNATFSFKQPMLVKSYTVGDYTPGFPYSGIQGGRNYVLASSGTNALPSTVPTLSGATPYSNAQMTYQPDGITLTNETTNKTQERYFQVASAWTSINNVPLNPGQTFTYSADVMGTVPQAVLRWGFQGTGGYESFQAFKITNATTWQRISVTLTVPTGATSIYLRLQLGINGQYQTGWAGGETLRFRNVKVEDGSVATAWSPAPEDLVATANSASYRYLRFNGQGNNVNDGVHFTQIEALTNKGVNVMSGLSATLWGSGTGTIRSGTNGSATNGDFTNNTYLELVNVVNKNQFAVYDLGSQRFDLDKLRMTMWGPDRIYYGVLAQASADGVNWTTIFKGNIDNTTLYNGIVSSTVSFGTSLAPVQAAQATATTANGTANSAQSAAKAVTDKVNSLSVGGRNLLLDTVTRTAVGQNGTNKTPDTFKWTLAGGLNVGNLYTAWGNNAPISLSFDWSITGTTIAGTFSPQWSSSPWGIGVPNVPSVTVSSSKVSGHYTFSTVTASGWSGSTANQLHLRTDNLQGTLTITNLKFEQGNLPTAWSPAPEDVDGAIKKVSNDLKLTVDGYSLGTTVDGKLVSGFTGNQQQVTIKGNMVTLDANTVVSNDFIAKNIKTDNLSSISAVLGDVTSGSITNLISGVRTGHSDSTLSGTTIIDKNGIDMKADVLVSGTKMFSEQLRFSPDTGILFKWLNQQGSVIRNTTIDDLGVTVSSGGAYSAGFSEMGLGIEGPNGAVGQLGVGGAYSTEFQTFTKSFYGQNLEVKLNFYRQGNVVMVNLNMVTYGPTLQGDAALMNGGKIPVGYRPIFPVDMVVNANSSGGSQSGMVVSLDTTGDVYKTGPAWSGGMRIMAHTAYLTASVGPSTANNNQRSDGYGNINP